jgi:hypothetical protein
MESTVNQKHLVARLVEKANKYRNFARWVGDRETVQGILALVEELKQRARALAKPNEEKIRVRAREIWEENDRPAGRDVEFWLQAEREFREAEDLAKESMRIFSLEQPSEDRLAPWAVFKSLASTVTSFLLPNSADGVLHNLRESTQWASPLKLILSAARMSFGSRPVSPRAGTKNSIIKRRKRCSKLSTKSPPGPMDKNCPICFGIGWVCDKHPDRA